jgi:beta-glucanase (GH16 family)
MGMFVGARPAIVAHASMRPDPQNNVVDGPAAKQWPPPWQVQKATPQSSGAQSSAPEWLLVWSDEFSGTGGVDTTQWLYDVGTSYPGGPENWGTGEVDTLTNSTNNVFRSGGDLHIRALHTGTDPIMGWTSGRIETQRTDFQPPPGGILAVEASIQLPSVSGTAATGYWPAFWMLGGPYRGVYDNWPGIGEIDIMENVNGLNEWSGTFHCGIENDGPCHETGGLGSSMTGFSPSLQTAFHTYRIEFDKSVSPQEIRWYVDGQQYFSVSANDVDPTDPTTWADATNHGFFILLNVAIGGTWLGNPTSDTESGGTMLVDYVRVYEWPTWSTYLPLVRRN